MKHFNYECKVWGASPIKPTPFYIQGLKLKYTLEALPYTKGTVLDVGCGGGNMAKAIKNFRPDLDIYGVDISSHAITEAKKDSQGVNFAVANGEKLPYKDQTFDMIVVYDVLEHLYKPEKTLREIKRVLKKNGMLHIFSPLDGQPFTFPWLFYSSGWRVKDKHTGHVQLFSDSLFQQVLEQNGFVVKKRLFSFHYFFQLFDVAYFTMLDLFDLRVGTSIEGMITDKKSHIFFSFFSVFYKFIVMIGHFESRMLKYIPGAGGHYTAVLD